VWPGREGDSEWLGLAWRYVAIAGTGIGLVVSPTAGMAPGLAPGALAVALAFGLLLVLARPGPAHAARGRPGRAAGGGVPLAWLAVVAACCALGGLAVGTLRLDAIDDGAYRGKPGRAVELHGFVTAVPRRSDGEVRVRVETADGRLLVVAPEPVPELPVGREVAVGGTLRRPSDWERDYLERLGIATVVAAGGLELTGHRRGGLASLGDRIRDRAETALERGTPPAEAALLRGFVLGQDDRIDPRTVDDFQRSGLAHLLAVSGQNVLLLALLATPILALLGVALRARLICVLVLIAVYVPVAGAGPSIQRAGIMGAAAVIAALASRPASRWHAMALAAVVTLVIDPRASADVGWQLSFAAVAGIAAWTPGLRLAFRRSGTAEGPARPAGPAGPGAAMADAAAVTVAATVATAPLMAYHFEAVSVAALPANLLALPAVAPVMWLGMLSAAAGQLPFIPVEPLTGLAGLLAAYIAQVARWLATPGWAQADVGLDDPSALGFAYALLGAGLGVVIAAARRRTGLRGPGGRRGQNGRRRRARMLVAVAGLAAIAAVALAIRPSADDAGAGHGLRVTVLDVGQGDSILLAAPGGEEMLIDGGPPGEELPERLRALGVDRLEAAILTHDQLDHVAGVEEVLGEVPVERFVFARAGRRLLGDARAAGAMPIRARTGAEISSGDLRLQVLWPPRPLLHGPPEEDPNRLSLVLLVRWHGFRMLLTGDAEAESVPLDPGGIDVLKVAHHGSEDAGLDGLLDRTQPRLAVVSVGEDNGYGHPAAGTLATLSEHGIPVLRTDLDGEITIAVAEKAWTATAAD
jgi:competence protein ComEC